MASMLGKPLLGILLLLAATLALVSALHNLDVGGGALLKADGALAIAIFALSVYGGLAFLLEDLQQKPVLPVLRTGAAESAFEDDLPAQLARLKNEAGVRQQL